jgi:hypothetical protein
MRRNEGVNFKIGRKGSEQKAYNRKDTKEHKGEFEAWPAAGDAPALLHLTGSSPPEFAFVFLGVLCG